MTQFIIWLIINIIIYEYEYVLQIVKPRLLLGRNKLSSLSAKAFHSLRKLYFHSLTGLPTAAAFIVCIYTFSSNYLSLLLYTGWYNYFNCIIHFCLQQK